MLVYFNEMQNFQPLDYMPGSELDDLFDKRCITEEPCVTGSTSSLLSPIPPFFSTPPLYVTPSVPNQNDRQTLCRERQKEWKGRAEILSPLRLCVENSFGGREHPWKSFLYIQTLIHPPPPHLIFDEWSDALFREKKNAVMTEIFPSYFKLTF